MCKDTSKHIWPMTRDAGDGKASLVKVHGKDGFYHPVFLREGGEQP